jgi:hypothetical protein
MLTACASAQVRPPTITVADDADEPDETEKKAASRTVSPTSTLVTPPPLTPKKTESPALDPPPTEPAPVVAKPARRPAQPKPAVPDPAIDARERALTSLRVPFVARQHITYRVEDEVKESTGELTVYSGRGYRLKITLPLGIVALDLQVRCNKYSYHVPLKLKHLRGPLKQAIKDIPYFPIAAIFSMFDPTLEGTWQGRNFVAKAERIKAKVHKTLPAFVEWSVIDGNDQPIVMSIKTFATFDDGVLLPGKFHVGFSDGRTMDLEAEKITRETPSEEDALDAISCE